jgi:hypothetical protein
VPLNAVSIRNSQSPIVHLSNSNNAHSALSNTATTTHLAYPALHPAFLTLQALSVEQRQMMVKGMLKNKDTNGDGEVDWLEFRPPLEERTFGEVPPDDGEL